MKLPTIDIPTFSVTLPSTGKTIQMRPYLVREEKILLMAQESDDLTAQIGAMAQIIKNCTDGVIDPHVVPYFDIEYLLLQLRARSVSEIVSPIYQCRNIPAGAEEPCGHKTTTTINLSDISVKLLNRDNPAMTIKIADKFTVKLRYPTIHTINSLLSAAINTEQQVTPAFMEGLCDLFDTLTDHTTNAVYEFDSYSTDEKMTFLESLSPEIYHQLVSIIDTMPTLSHQIDYTCAQCGFEHHLTLSGVADFLV